MDFASLISTGLSLGSKLMDAASGLIGPKAEAVITQAKAVVSAATATYTAVKDTLGEDDVATLDTQLRATHDKVGLDFDRVLAELDAAAKN